jgi:hypothetical protein
MKAKMTMVASVLLIALMAVGVSYALWSKTLVINGTAGMGTLDAWFTDWYWNASLDQAGTPVPLVKKTYTVNIYYGADEEYLHVDILDLYPCIWINIYYNITNTGTIPWKVQNVTVTDITGNFPGDIINTPANLVGTQVESNAYVTGDLHIHLNNWAAEDGGVYYWFLVNIRIVQWNEYVKP